MEENDLEALWDALRKASSELLESEQNFKLARKALVSRLCDCYREDEDWEDRATWCVTRMLNQCPYYLEFKNLAI